MNMSIRLENVNYIYGEGTGQEKWALKNINLTLHDNEFVGIVGHTGSGKSTLTQLLNGLEKPSSGQIFYNEQDIQGDGFSKKELRQKVGLVFQYPEHQLFEVSVIKDVEFGPRNLGLTNLEIEKRSFDALKQVGISDDLLDVAPFALSGGQKRRVAIAGVLAMQPEVLILDEPTAGLDPAGRTEILELLQNSKEVLQCYHVTGVYTFLVKVSCGSMPQLEHLILQFQKLGTTSTQIILSTPVNHGELDALML